MFSQTYAPAEVTMAASAIQPAVLSSEAGAIHVPFLCRPVILVSVRTAAGLDVLGSLALLCLARSCTK